MEETVQSTKNIGLETKARPASNKVWETAESTSGKNMTMRGTSAKVQACRSPNSKFEKKIPQRTHNVSQRPQLDKSKRKTVEGSASLTRPEHPLLAPPGFEKITVEKMSPGKEERGSSGPVGTKWQLHQDPERGKKGLNASSQSSALEKGGRFARGPDDLVTFDRPKSQLLNYVNKGKKNCDMELELEELIDLGRTHFLKEEVAKLAESIMCSVEKTVFSTVDTIDSQNSVHSSNFDKNFEYLGNDYLLPLSKKNVTSCSKENLADEEYIEKIVLSPGLLLNTPYNTVFQSYDWNGDAKNFESSRFTKWTEEPAEIQEEFVNIKSTESFEKTGTPVELEKTIDFFLASVRNQALSEKHTSLKNQTIDKHKLEYPTGMEVLENASQNGHLSHVSQGEPNGFNIQSHKQHLGLRGHIGNPLKGNDNQQFHKETPSIALIDPAICEARMKSRYKEREQSLQFGPEDASLAGSSRYSPSSQHSRQPIDPSMPLKKLIGVGAGGHVSPNFVSEKGNSTLLHKPWKEQANSFSSVQHSFHRQPLYAEDLERKLISRTIDRSPVRTTTVPSTSPSRQDQRGKLWENTLKPLK